jgi:hypothetical protein
MTRCSSLLLVLLLAASVCAFGQSTLLDPLHGFCAGAGQCIDNGTNSPTSTNPPSDFGFTVSPGPQTGDLLLEILVPGNEQTAGASYAITGAATGNATLFSAIDFTSGDLGAYLGQTISSPANPIGGFLPATQALDPGATGFSVYQFDAGTQLLQDASNPNVSPLFNIVASLGDPTGTIPIGSYIVGFLDTTTGCGPKKTEPCEIATALSGAIFETSASTSTSTTSTSTSLSGPFTTGNNVPEPGSVVLFGSALLAVSAILQKKKSARS